VTTLDPLANPIAAEHYGAKTVAVEPGGVEIIPESERHGSPVQLLGTWITPNLEFATITVGILGPLAFGLTFWQSVAAIVVGTALGSLTHGILSSWGPETGLCQMVLSRTGFGFLGNVLPAGLNAVIAGVGWFAVNTVSGALALHALFSAIPVWICVLVVVAAQLAIAVYGHNLVQAFERIALPLLGVVFAVGVVIVLSKAHPGASRLDPGFPLPTSGGFTILAAAAFGYACGWNPYAADYTRYLPASSDRRLTGLYAGIGVFVSCVVLEVAGAASVNAVAAKGVDPGIYTSMMPTWICDLTLLCIAIGAVAANALNIYSGAMSFMALGVRLPLHRARAIVALVFGVAGLVLALIAAENPKVNYENFLLVIAYWIGPWLGVVLTDRVLRRGTDVRERIALATSTTYSNWAGPIAMAVGMVLSIWLFSNQTKYIGVVPKAHAGLGDVTFVVGFVVAAAIYGALFKAMSGPSVPASADAPAA
jgi:NCS1 nucleoside transporter family